MLLKTPSLPLPLLQIICDKATERPFTGQYHELPQTAGTYLCRQCGLALFRSGTQFHAACGWPSFDQSITDAVKQRADPDGQRQEIICARCDAHLGHIFYGEGLTVKNNRHCVNSLSLDFVPALTIMDTAEAIFAAGCFWGVEYFFQKLDGVLKTEVGYTGGQTENPSYRDICTGTTGHFEATRILYDPTKITYEKLAKFFFEIHDPVQANGQGLDKGHQYLSVAFYYDAAQKTTLQSLIAVLEAKGLAIATQLLPVSVFWPAESAHQNYYNKKQQIAACHQYTKRFD
jgi:peptide methionine sulfoxide reductase msrA/msrB